jgi:hypothetical protein
MSRSYWHYGLDFCAGFWDWLVAKNDAGKVYSIAQVGDEIDESAAISTFLQFADYDLVAHALAHEDVLVTHEHEHAD